MEEIKRTLLKQAIQERFYGKLREPENPVGQFLTNFQTQLTPKESTLAQLFDHYDYAMNQTQDEDVKNDLSEATCYLEGYWDCIEKHCFQPTLQVTP